ncbi:MAG: hypothetical protein PHW10_03860 [Candidatus Peribacteraceae bacterium]|nr:hypothetical protein [Candidatus Peribacteraceae bacterium]
MWQFDPSKFPLIIGFSIASILFSLLLDLYLIRSCRTDEAAELLALRLNDLGTFIALISITSASGISFGGAAPLVATFSFGSPIALNLLIYSHSIRVGILKRRIAQSREVLSTPVLNNATAMNENDPDLIHASLPTLSQLELPSGEAAAIAAPDVGETLEI